MSDFHPTTIEKLEEAVWPSFVMLAGIQLDIFTHIEDRRMTTEEIAAAINVSAEKLKPLLYALAAARLLTVENGLFSNTSESRSFLIQGTPLYRGGKHEVLANNWKAGLLTADSIRTGMPQKRRDFASASRETLEAFYRSNHSQAVRRGQELLRTYGLSAHGTLVDVGGGSGGLAIAIAEACPSIQATVVDLPSVTPITRRIIEETGATDRVQVITADILTDDLKDSYDAAVLSSVIQVISAEKAQRMLKNIAKAVNPGGAIYIRGDVLDDSGVSPIGAVMRNLIYLNTYDEGQAYTEKEHKDWLREAGFVDLERKILSDGFSLLRAWKPL